jgi:hypothetical protein
MTEPSQCPRCGSPDPKKHPAMQFEGEVEICKHPWHTPASQPADPDEMADPGKCEHCGGYHIGGCHHAPTPVREGWALTKLGNYLLAHQNVIDASWCAKVIDEARQELESLRKERDALLAQLKVSKT